MLPILHLFERYSKNPILIPQTRNRWESKAVFNCGAIFDDKIHLFYRAIGEYQKYVSSIGYAYSNDGYSFERQRNIAIPTTESYEKYGMEDPRITKIQNKIIITYVVLTDYVTKQPKVSSALAITPDYVNFKKLGILTDYVEENKDVVFFAEKLNSNNGDGGSFFSLHRPGKWVGRIYGTNKPSIWIGEGNSLNVISKFSLLMKPEQDWESLKIGVGPPPIKTSKGWLIIYHGVDNNRVYRVGAALLDLQDPRKILARTKDPIFEPTETYERFGDVNNVVFPTGLTVIDRKIFMYYGAGDKVCCLAIADTDQLIEHVLTNSLASNTWN